MSTRCSISVEIICLTACTYKRIPWKSTIDLDQGYIPSIRQVTNPQALKLALTAVHAVNDAVAQHDRWKAGILSKRFDERYKHVAANLDKVKSHVDCISRFQTFIRLGHFPDPNVKFREPSSPSTSSSSESSSDLSTTSVTERIPRASPLFKLDGQDREQPIRARKSPISMLVGEKQPVPKLKR